MAEQDLQELKRSVAVELREAKQVILKKMECKLDEFFDKIPTEARELPLWSLVEGLGKNYNGKSMVVKENKDLTELQNRPSVVLKVEDLSFVFDGNKLKISGTNYEERYKGMIEEINDVLKKHMGIPRNA